MTCTALILCLPLFLFVALLIKLSGAVRSEDKGPLFRYDIRMSEGKPFRCYKFRLIRQGVLEGLSRDRAVGWSKRVEVPENCTAVGKVLKRWYLDELPQLYNVLKGDMSWVGPRPFPVEDYEDDVKKGRARKRIIRPGLTGLFQIHKGARRRKSDVELDEEYIEKVRSLTPFQLWLYDWGILLRTPRVLIQAKGL